MFSPERKPRNAPGTAEHGSVAESICRRRLLGAGMAIGGAGVLTSLAASAAEAAKNPTAPPPHSPKAGLVLFE